MTSDGRGRRAVHRGLGLATEADAELTHAYRSGVSSMTKPVVPLSDVPLIVEDLLLRARQLADCDAPTHAVEAILDHVAALREGRG